MEFDLEEDIPIVVSVWIKLSHIPLACWGDDHVQAIGNTLGKYVERVIPKGKQFSCAQIFVEVDIEEGLPSKIHLTHET
jgi:hypothetical protein